MPYLYPLYIRLMAAQPNTNDVAFANAMQNAQGIPLLRTITIFVKHEFLR